MELPHRIREVEDYLRHSLHYELDAGDLAGLDLFYRLAAEDGLVPTRRPLDLAGAARMSP